MRQPDRAAAGRVAGRRRGLRQLVGRSPRALRRLELPLLQRRRHVSGAPADSTLRHTPARDTHAAASHQSSQYVIIDISTRFTLVYCIASKSRIF